MEDAFYDRLVSRPDLLVAVAFSCFVFFESSLFESFLLELLEENPQFASLLCKFYCKFKYAIYLSPLLLVLVQQPIFILAVAAFVYVTPCFPEWFFLSVGLLTTVYFISNTVDSKFTAVLIIAGFLFLNYSKIIDRKTCFHSGELAAYCKKRNFSYTYLSLSYE